MQSTNAELKTQNASLRAELAELRNATAQQGLGLGKPGTPGVLSACMQCHASHFQTILIAERTRILAMRGTTESIMTRHISPSPVSLKMCNFRLVKCKASALNHGLVRRAVPLMTMSCRQKMCA